MEEYKTHARKIGDLAMRITDLVENAPGYDLLDQIDALNIALGLINQRWNRAVMAQRAVGAPPGEDPGR